MAWCRAVWHEMRLRWLHQVAPGESVVAWVKSISLGGDLAKMPNVFALPPFVCSFFPHLLCIQYTHTYVHMYLFLHSLCQLINFSYFPRCPCPKQCLIMSLKAFSTIMRSLELRNKLSKLLRMQDLCGWCYYTGTDTTYICI